MTTMVRYVQNTMDGGTNTPKVSSTGSDYQLMAFDIVTTAGIAAGANLNVLVWEGAGLIKSILAVRAVVAATGQFIPMGAVAANTHALITIDATQKIINISIPAAGAVVPINSRISLLLVVGSY